jgi:hypothetical protein
MLKDFIAAAIENSALFRHSVWFACRGAASPNRPFVLAAAFSLLQRR